MAEITFEPGDVVIVDGTNPALILQNNNILVIFKRSRSIIYASRMPIAEQNLSLLRDEEIKMLPFEIKLAFESVLEALQIKNLALNVAP